jgi:hypothetical protein
VNFMKFYHTTKKELENFASIDPKSTNRGLI